MRKTVTVSQPGLSRRRLKSISNVIGVLKPRTDCETIDHPEHPGDKFFAPSKGSGFGKAESQVSQDRRRFCGDCFPVRVLGASGRTAVRRSSAGRPRSDPAVPRGCGNTPERAGSACKLKTRRIGNPSVSALQRTTRRCRRPVRQSTGANDAVERRDATQCRAQAVGIRFEREFHEVPSRRRKSP